MAVGLGLRVGHYLRQPSLWHDEAAVVVNVLQKDYADLWGSLLFSEAAPPLFLWLEKLVVSLAGDSLYSFRLVPLLASCAALVCLVWCARRILAPEAVPWVALVAACSDTIMWHSCEAKPYAVDMFVAAGLLALTVLCRDWPVCYVLLLAAAIAPLLIFVSFPACFLLGGLALFLLPAVRRAKSAASWAAYGLFVISMGASFGLLLLGPVHAQKDDRMLSCWIHIFPNWQRPWSLPSWVLVRSTEVARYVYEPAGNVLAAVMAVGAVMLWRQGQRRLVIFLVTPIALAAGAGLFWQYPYGAVRVMTFAAPACWLLLGAGMPTAFSGLSRFGWAAPAVLGLIVLFPVAQAGYRLLVPWKRAQTGPASAYVLARMRPDEPVIGNAWEDLYYFRDPAVRYRGCGDLASLVADRAWVIATSADPKERQEVLQHLQDRGPWRLLETREFERVSVHRLELDRKERRAQAGP
jgi:hypothetical protein